MPMLQDPCTRLARASGTLLVLVSALAIAPTAARAQRTPAPTRLEVTGTSASATVTWQPVDGAVSYSVKRWKQDDLKCCNNSVKGLTVATWTDNGATREGFPQPGVYVFEVTAQLKETSGVAVINWTLPPGAAPALIALAPAAIVGAPASTATVTVKAPLRQPPSIGAPTVNTLAGPAPQNVRVLPGGPMIHTLVWDPAPGNSGYKVFRYSNARGEWMPANSPPLLTEMFPDTNLVLPGSKYRVTALYADGRQGSTDFVYASPPPLQVPTGFRVEQTSPGTVLLSWKPVAFAKGYRVMGSGRPADGTFVDASQPGFHAPGYGQFVYLRNLAGGTYSWQVTADYGGAYQTAGMPTASITVVAPVDPYTLSPRFRVSILGFKAIVEQNDDLLSRDGKHNEVYAAAVVCPGIRPTPPYDPHFLSGNYYMPTQADCQLVRSAVHGDVNNFPDRVQAGSASASGGITSGDVVGAGPSGATTGSNSTFPFLLWEGSLLKGKEAVWIAPSLWERGGQDRELYAWKSNIKDQLNYRTPAGPTGAGMDVLVGGFVMMDMVHLPLRPLCAFNYGSDRPIGLDPSPNPGWNPPGLRCHVIGLTREKAEAVLGGAPQEAGKPVGVLTVDLPDAVSGHYEMYLKLERLP